MCIQLVTYIFIRNNDFAFYKSITNNEIYKIIITPSNWICSSNNQVFNGINFKSMYSAEYNIDGCKNLKVKDRAYAY